MLRVFITLFNLQGARRPAKLRYDIMPFSFCQALFSIFFELFLVPSSAGTFDLSSPNLVEPGRALVSDFVMLPLVPKIVKHFFRILEIFFNADLL